MWPEIGRKNDKIPKRRRSRGMGDAEERKEVVTQSSGRGSRTFSYTTGKGSRNRKLK